MAKSLYTLLGVKKSATKDEIKTAYRKLAKKYHPDRNPGDKKAEERFKEISGAFETLSDREGRKLYDEFGDDALQPGFDAAKARAYRTWQSRATGGIRFEDAFAGAGRGSGGFSFDNLGDVFGDLFGGKKRDGGFTEDMFRRGPKKGGDAESKITIRFEEAIKGVQKQLTLSSQGGPQQKLKVRIPSGVEDGQRIRLAGKGMPGPGGGQPGDLFLTVQVKKHAYFERDGTNLLLRVPITIPEAILGARIEIPTLDRPVKMTVPKGSQSGDTLRLKGKGVPPRGKRAAGDLYVTLSIRVPENTGDDMMTKLAERFEPFYSNDIRKGLKD